MSISLSVLFIPYGLFLVMVGIFSLVNIGNFIKFGLNRWIDFLATVIYLIGAAVIIFFTWQEVQMIDWSQSLNFNAPSFNNIFEIPR